jgi:zona occludens toxin (predicted ATPase)
MFAALLPYRLMIEICAALALIFGAALYIHHDGYKSAKNEDAAIQLKATQAANAALLAANTRAANLTAQYAQIQQKMETQANEDQKIIDTAHSQLIAIKRLRDPYASLADNCKLSTHPTTASTTTDDPAPGELSEQLTNFLEQQAYEADKLAVYAKTCHDWVVGLQENANK